MRRLFSFRMSLLLLVALFISLSGLVHAQDTGQSTSSAIGTTQFGILSLKSPSATLETERTKQQIYKDISKASFITGGLSAIATGIVYFIGKSTMASYINATDPTDAKNLHAQLSNYNSMFFTYLSVSAVGLTLGGILVALAPRPAKIDEQVQGSIDQLQKLKAERADKGQE
jgi:hypothetical protein